MLGFREQKRSLVLLNGTNFNTLRDTYDTYSYDTMNGSTNIKFKLDKR